MLYKIRCGLTSGQIGAYDSWWKNMEENPKKYLESMPQDMSKFLNRKIKIGNYDSRWKNNWNPNPEILVRPLKNKFKLVPMIPDGKIQEEFAKK